MKEANPPAPQKIIGETMKLHGWTDTFHIWISWMNGWGTWTAPSQQENGSEPTMWAAILNLRLHAGCSPTLKAILGPGFGSALKNISIGIAFCNAAKPHIHGSQQGGRDLDGRPRFLPGIDGGAWTNPLWIFRRQNYLHQCDVLHVGGLRLLRRSGGPKIKDTIGILSLPTQWHWIRLAWIWCTLMIPAGGGSD